MGCSHVLNKRQKETHSESLVKFIRSFSRLASVVKGAHVKVSLCSLGGSGQGWPLWLRGLSSKLDSMVKGALIRLDSMVKGALIKVGLYG